MGRYVVLADLVADGWQVSKKSVEASMARRATRRTADEDTA